MKKLLGLVGTITIAGSGMLGIVGNASTTRIEKNFNFIDKYWYFNKTLILLGF